MNGHLEAALQYAERGWYVYAPSDKEGESQPVPINDQLALDGCRCACAARLGDVELELGIAFSRHNFWRCQFDDHSRPATQKEIATAFGLDHSTVTQHIKKLRAKNWLEKETLLPTKTGLAQLVEEPANAGGF